MKDSFIQVLEHKVPLKGPYLAIHIHVKEKMNSLTA